VSTGSLVIPFSAAPTDNESLLDDIWLTLEQASIPVMNESVYLKDITSMWNMVMTGASATNYVSQTCPVSVLNGVITIRLGVYVFPCSQDMQYTMTISNGEFGPMVQKDVSREFDLLFPQSDSVALDFVPNDDITFEWETDAYNEFGEMISRPEITLENNVVKMSASCFCVLRCKCTTLADYYPVFIYVVKAVDAEPTEEDLTRVATCKENCEALYGVGGSINANRYLPCIEACNKTKNANAAPDRTGYSISNLQSTVQATWMGSDGKLDDESLSLTIPECVKKLLEMCDDGTMKSPLYGIDDGSDKITTVYYSTCTGNILDVRDEYPDANKHLRKKRVSK